MFNVEGLVQTELKFKKYRTIHSNVLIDELNVRLQEKGIGSAIFNGAFLGGYRQRVMVVTIESDDALKELQEYAEQAPLAAYEIEDGKTITEKYELPLTIIIW